MRTEKYTVVGKLLRPGEEPSSYSDEEDETTPIANISASEPAATTPAVTTDKPKAE